MKTGLPRCLMPVRIAKMITTLTGYPIQMVSPENMNTSNALQTKQSVLIMSLGMHTYIDIEKKST